MSVQPPPRLLTVEGASKWLGLEVKAIRWLIETRRIPYVRIGRRIYFDQVDLDRWIDTHRVAPVAPQDLTSGGVHSGPSTAPM